MRWLAVVLALLAGCRPEEDLRRPDAPIDAPAVVGNYRIATFNVRRFFDTVCDSGACAPGDYEELPSQQAFDDRATQIADAIRALDADLVALEEVETQACLDALLVRLADVMPYGALGEIGFAGSVDVAIVSKTPLDRITGHRASEPQTNFSRELLEVHANGGSVVMFAAHFKAKVNDDPARRLAEARTSARLVNELAVREPEAIVVLAGDLNDTPGSPPLDALTVDGKLIRVADDLPIAEQATYVYNGNGQAIDHILLAPGREAMRAPHSSRVWRDAPGWGGSDHSALSSDFAIP